MRTCLGGRCTFLEVLRERCTCLEGDAPMGQRQGLASRGRRCAAPEPEGGMRAGAPGPLGLGLSIPPPRSAGASAEEPPGPGASAASADPAFTLPAAQLLFVF